MSLPGAESRLQAHLGNRFVDSDWRTALATVMEAEEDTEKALQAIVGLRKAAIARSGLKLRIPARPTNTVAAKSQQPSLVEEDLMGKVELLKSRNRIFGEIPTVEELLNPVEEREQEEPVTDGSVKGIIEHVRREAAEANGEVVEADESGGDDEHEGLGDDSPVQSCSDLISLCRQLAQSCLQYGDPQSSLDLSNQLLKFRGVLLREELLNSTQTTLDRFFEK